MKLPAKIGVSDFKGLAAPGRRKRLPTDADRLKNLPAQIIFDPFPVQNDPQKPQGRHETKDKHKRGPSWNIHGDHETGIQESSCRGKQVKTRDHGVFQLAVFRTRDWKVP
jgi:hypothetical protein